MASVAEKSQYRPVTAGLPTLGLSQRGWLHAQYGSALLLGDGPRNHPVGGRQRIGSTLGRYQTGTRSTAARLALCGIHQADCGVMQFMRDNRLYPVRLCPAAVFLCCPLALASSRRSCAYSTAHQPAAFQEVVERLVCRPVDRTFHLTFRARCRQSACLTRQRFIVVIYLRRSFSVSHLGQPGSPSAGYAMPRNPGRCRCDRASSGLGVHPMSGQEIREAVRSTPPLAYSDAAAPVAVEHRSQVPGVTSCMHALPDIVCWCATSTVCALFAVDRVGANAFVVPVRRRLKRKLKHRSRSRTAPVTYREYEPPGCFLSSASTRIASLQNHNHGAPRPKVFARTTPCYLHSHRSFALASDIVCHCIFEGLSGPLWPKRDHMMRSRSPACPCGISGHPFEFVDRLRVTARCDPRPSRAHCARNTRHCGDCRCHVLRGRTTALC